MLHVTLIRFNWYSIDLLSIGVWVDVCSVFVHYVICETCLV